MSVADVLPERLAARLPGFVAERSGARSVHVLSVSRLGGGAIQDNFAVALELDGGDMPGRHELVLRTDAPSAVAVSLPRGHEFALLGVARTVGMTVPEPLWCSAADDEGGQFFLMRRVAGSADGTRIARSLGGTAGGEALAERLGAELARLHTVAPPHPALAFLPVPDGNPGLARIALYRGYLDALAGPPQLAIEYALAWLERHVTPAERVTLCHCDLRSGNYLVEDGRLSAVLDWEFAAWSDPLEDLGWFCARSWRFGNWTLEAGGIAAREHFYRGYERESDRRAQSLVTVRDEDEEARP